jgi:hypothetical protein
MQVFTVDLRSEISYADLVACFNVGLIGPSGGEWLGNNWNAFHDYLSWPSADTYELKILGWRDCPALSEKDRAMMQEIFTDNPHVKITLV